MSANTALAPTSSDGAHASSPAHGEVTSEPVTLARLIRSEWIKFRSLRSTVGVLAGAVLGMLIIALIVAYNTRRITPSLQFDDLAPSATLQGYYLGQLLIGALGVVFVSGEYSTGMIRSTFAAAPRRLPVLWAKLVVLTSITAVTMISVCVVAFLSGQALISHYRPGYSLSDPGVTRIVIGTGVYLTLLVIIGSAVAWIVRSTPGSLVAYVALVLVLPGLFSSVLGRWGKHVAEYMPSEAGGSFVRSIREPFTLAPWPGLAVMAAWALAGVALAAVQLRRRDA